MRGKRETAGLPIYKAKQRRGTLSYEFPETLCAPAVSGSAWYGVRNQLRLRVDDQRFGFDGLAAVFQPCNESDLLFPLAQCGQVVAGVHRKGLGFARRDRQGAGLRLVDLFAGVLNRVLFPLLAL